MFLFIIHSQAFTENSFLIFYIWWFFEQLLEQLPHTILSYYISRTYISVPALCPFKAHPTASWTSRLTGPSVNLGCAKPEIPGAPPPFSNCFAPEQYLAVPVCQLWRELDLPSCQALLTMELSLTYPGLFLSFTYHERHMDHHGYNFGN